MGRDSVGRDWWVAQGGTGSDFGFIKGDIPPVETIKAAVGHHGSWLYLTMAGVPVEGATTAPAVNTNNLFVRHHHCRHPSLLVQPTAVLGLELAAAPTASLTKATTPTPAGALSATAETGAAALAAARPVGAASVAPESAPTHQDTT